MNKKRNSIF